MPRLKKSPPDPYKPVVSVIWSHALDRGVTATAEALGVSNNWLHRRRRSPGMLRLKDIGALVELLDIPPAEIREALPW